MKNNDVKMNRTTEALLARRALAEKATPGPWKLTGIPDVVDVLAVDTRDVVGVGYQMPDARHIAANSPDVVMADIDEILRLRTIVEHLQEENSILRYEKLNLGTREELAHLNREADLLAEELAGGNCPDDIERAVSGGATLRCDKDCKKCWRNWARDAIYTEDNPEEDDPEEE